MNQTKPVLLVPVDFSDTSQKALEHAKNLSTRLGADLVLLYVFEPPMMLYPDVSPGLIESIYQESLPASQRALEALGKKVGAARTIFREGNAGTEIVRVAGEISPELVAIGTHGRKGIKRILLGSVAEYVIRHSTIPVLTVRTDAA